MTYARFHDRMDDNGKVVEAGPLVRDLHAQAIRYCSRELTDGALPMSIMRKIAREIAAQMADSYGCTIDPAALIAQGLACHLLEQDEDGYVVHDYLDWNSSREQVMGLLGERASAGSLGGKRSVETRRARYGTAQPTRREANPEASASDAPEANRSKPRSKTEASPEAKPKPEPRTQNPDISVVPGTTSSVRRSKPDEPDLSPIVEVWNANRGGLPACRKAPSGSDERKALRRALNDCDGDLVVLGRTFAAASTDEYYLASRYGIVNVCRHVASRWRGVAEEPRAAQRVPVRDPSIDAVVAGRVG